MSNERNINFDILRGVAIILMVLGHCDTIIRPIIFSFHMPLFFFLSGYLYKKKHIKDIITANVKKVILPYILVVMLVAIIKVFAGDYLWGVKAMTGLSWFVGPLWFLACFFVCHIYFYYGLKIKQSMFAVILLSLWIVVTILRQYGVPPFVVMNAIPATLCMLLGYMIKDKKVRDIIFNKRLVIIGLLLCVISIKLGTLSMASVIYPLWAFSIIGAFFTTYTIYLIIRKLNLVDSIIGGVISMFGKNSLFFLCVHSIDYLLDISPKVCTILLSENGNCVFALFLCKMVFIIITYVILNRFSLIKKIFSIR